MTTILINTFNERPEWLAQNIESQLAQHGEKQIIVSTMLQDKNHDLLMQYRRRNKIEVSFCDHTKHPGHSPEGAFYQINSALHLVRGEWFYYFSSNDYVDEMKIKNEKQRCIDTGKLICYSSFYHVDNDGKVMSKKTFPEKYDYQLHLTGNFVSDGSLVHTSLLRKYAPFQSDKFGNYSFWDFWLRIYEGEGDVFCYSPENAFFYRQNEEAMHAKRRKSPEKMRQGVEWYKAMLAVRKK